MVCTTTENQREARLREYRLGPVMWTLQDAVVTDVDSLLADGACALECDGDLATGRRRFDAAYREAERLGDAAAMAAAAIGMGGLWVHEHRTVAGEVLLEDRLHRALSLIDPRSTTGLRLRARLAGEQSYRTGDPGPILAVLDEATADPVARAEALSIAHHCLLGPDHGTLRRALAVELVGLSFRTGRRSDLLMGVLWQTVDLFLDADPHAGRRLAELRESLARDDHLAVGFVADAIDVMLAIRTGDLDGAEALARACAERGRAAGDVDATGWYGAQLVAIRWYQGRLVEALPMLTELVDSPTLSAIDNSMLAALAVAAALAGDRPAATSALARLCGADLAALPRSSSWLVSMNGIVEAAHLLGDAETSTRAYELLRPYADLPMVGSLAVACFGSVQHALGVAALTAGELDRAVAHFHAAVRRNLALAHWPAVVLSRQRLAQALALRGGPQDAAEAERQLGAAAREASSAGPAGQRSSWAGTWAGPAGQRSSWAGTWAGPAGQRSSWAGPAGQRSSWAGTWAGPAGQRSSAVVQVPAARCVREGRRWRVAFGHRSVVVGHRIGLLHLAVLVANPGQEVDATDLAAGLSGGNGDGGTGGAAPAQPVLDEAAIRRYRTRLAQLPHELDAARPDRAARAREERDWLLAELAGATGLGGRTRAFPTNAERARIAVGKAIRRAVAHVAEADPVIGEHLAQSIRTGVRCAYWPV
jgi:hypothetical protein